MRRPSPSFVRTVPALLAVVLLAPSCSRGVFTAPPAATVAAPVPDAAAPPPPSRLSTPTGVTGSITPLPLDWKDLAAVLVVPGTNQVVSGGRYTLKFAKGSLSSDQLITIQDYDSTLIDVQFGPSGTKFDTPVELDIDFSGTAADPLSNYADASEPVLWYLNETTKRWEEVPGTTDWAHLEYVVHLEHFSRYVLGGKAGWKQTPRTDTAE